VKRKIDAYLDEWKRQSDRKALLVRGARQVGKTYAVRRLGKTFDHFLEVNFEEEKAVAAFFSGSLNPAEICKKLSAYFNIPLHPGRSLLFLDEIQACPDALRSLRFFHEKMPALHVAAAGSLLEFALEAIPSFGVGRITTLRMYPLTFSEFLGAVRAEALDAQVRQADPQHPLDPVLHDRLLDQVRMYQLVGGMPASVEAYSKDNDLLACQRILDDLLASIRADFAKYRKRSPTIRLQETLMSAARQAGGKFKYTNVSTENSSRAYKDSLDLLVQAGLVYKVYHSSSRGLPLGAQADNRKFKCLIFDAGIHQRLQGLTLSEHLVRRAAQLVNEGNLAEAFAGLELIGNGQPYVDPQLYYWHRESPGSNAEVDYVIQAGNRIVPIEVKAGTRGQMQSLFLFLKERSLELGVRVSHENFAEYGAIRTIPLYAVGRLAGNDPLAVEISDGDRIE